MQKKLALTLFGALFVSISFSQSPAQKSSSNIVFQSGFEEGNKSIWNDYDGNPDTENQILVDPGPFNKVGNHVIRLKVPEGQAGGSDLVKVFSGQYDSLYYRWYFKYEKGFNFNARNHGSGFFAGSRNYLGQSNYRPNGDDFIVGTLEYDPNSHRPYCYFYYRGMYQDCTNPNGACWGDHFPCTSDEGSGYCTKTEHRDPPLPPVLTDNTWYCLESKVKMGKPSANGIGSDGEFEFWLDGVSCGHWKNLWLRTTDQLKLTMLWLSLYHHDGTHSVAGILIDDVIVSTKPIGCSDIISGVGANKLNKEDIKIFPNPTKSMITISFSASRKFSVSIFDLSGKLIINKSFHEKEVSIDTHKFNPGIYCLTVKDETDNSLVWTESIICNN